MFLESRSFQKDYIYININFREKKKKKKLLFVVFSFIFEKPAALEVFLVYIFLPYLEVSFSFFFLNFGSVVIIFMHFFNPEVAL